MVKPEILFSFFLSPSVSLPSFFFFSFLPPSLPSFLFLNFWYLITESIATFLRKDFSHTHISKKRFLIHFLTSTPLSAVIFSQASDCHENCPKLGSGQMRLLCLLVLQCQCSSIDCTDWAILQLRGPPTSRPRVGASCQINSSSIRLKIRHTINVMLLEHPETFLPPPPVCGKIVFHKIDPCVKKIGDCCSSSIGIPWWLVDFCLVERQNN